VPVNRVIHRRGCCLEPIENLYSGCSVYRHSEIVDSYRGGPSRPLEAYTGNSHEQCIRLGLHMGIYELQEVCDGICELVKDNDPKLLGDRGGQPRRKCFGVNAGTFKPNQRRSGQVTYHD